MFRPPRRSRRGVNDTKEVFLCMRKQERRRRLRRTPNGNGIDKPSCSYAVPGTAAAAAAGQVRHAQRRQERVRAPARCRAAHAERPPRSGQHKPLVFAGAPAADADAPHDKRVRRAAQPRPLAAVAARLVPRLTARRHKHLSAAPSDHHIRRGRRVAPGAVGRRAVRGRGAALVSKARLLLCARRCRGSRAARKRDGVAPRPDADGDRAAL
eukprot:941632-Prymnesium_polylepis.1